MALVRQGHLDKAIAVFQKGLDRNPQNPVLLDAIGAAYSLESNFEQAKRYFLDSLEVDPQFIPARRNLAITHFNLGQYDLAAAEFTKLKDTHGISSAIPNLFLGMIQEKRRDYQTALLLLNRAGVLVYRYPEALLSLASSALNLGQLHRAVSALHSLEELPGVSASQYLKAGQLYARLGQDEQALAAFDKALARDRDLEGLEYERAVVLDQMNRSQEALAILKALAATKPDSDVLNLLAHVAEKNTDLELAIQSLRQAAKLDPNREDNYLDFSTICADYGNYPLALEAANVGLAHIPNSYRLFVQKGVVLDSLGRPDEAEEALRNASELQKDNSVALLSLAIVQTHAGQLEDAVKTLTAAIHRFPDNYYMYYQLGKVLVQVQEAHADDPETHTEALQAFTEAIRFKPSFADSYYQLAKLSLREAPKTAERNLVTCLRLDPHHAPAEYMLARLYLSTGRQVAGQALIDRFESQQQAAKLKEQQQPRIESAQK
jgi:tetratricopeptide (TPR) repeat protein